MADVANVATATLTPLEHEGRLAYAVAHGDSTGAVKAADNLPPSRFSDQSSSANHRRLTSVAYARCSSNHAEISVQYQRRPRCPNKNGRGKCGCFLSFQRVVRPTLKRTQISSTEPTDENGDGDLFIKIHQ